MSTITESFKTAVKHHETGEIEQAASLYREIVRVDPGHADALHLLGVTAHQRNDHKTAVAHIQKAIEINDSSALFHNNLGTSYSALGEAERGIDCFRAAIRVSPDFAGAHYNLAMALASQGKVDQAITSYWESIRFDRSFTSAYNNLGRIFTDLSRFTEAIHCFQHVVQAEPEHAEMHYNLANAYQANNQIDEAIAGYQEALRLKPDLAEANNNLGSAFKNLGRFDEAISCFRKAVAGNPEYVEAQFNLGNTFRLCGDHELAVEQLRRADVLRPDSADIRCSLAMALTETNHYDEAISYFHETLKTNPKHASTLFGLACVVLADGNHEMARETFEKLLIIDPKHLPALRRLSEIHASNDQLDAATECLQQAITIEPDDAENHYQMGIVRKAQSQLDAAVASFQRAVEINPQHKKAHLDLGVVYRYQTKLEQSIASHRRAVEIEPYDADAHFHLALSLLLQGELAEGWREYEWRAECKAEQRPFVEPAWDGSSLGNQKLLVYAEQGVGDEIMFASCLPQILGQGTQCVLECDLRLVGLFARSFPLANVVERPSRRQQENEVKPPAFDVQIAMGTLPKFTRPSLETFPPVGRYLVPDAERLEKWRSRYAELGEGLKVGISWWGGNQATVQRQRSISLEQWDEILQVPGIQFVNLQYGVSDGELANVHDKTGVTIHDWDDVDPLVDLEDFAAQIAALDLVISVDNSTVHMAAALEIPVWTLLCFSPNWRWMLDRPDSPWYPSVKLFRQSSPGDWEPVLKQVAGELTNDVKPQPSPTQTDSLLIVGIDALVIPQPSECPQPSDTAPRSRGDNRDTAEPLPQQRTVQAEITPLLETTTDEEQAKKEKNKYETIWAHDAYRIVSPGALNIDKVPLVDELRKHEVKTLLDAGCGTGKLMKILIDEFGNEFDVHGFDISANCLDPALDDVKDEILTIGCLWNPDEFFKEYDAIICTDVLEHIPTEHVRQVLSNLKTCCRKLCYLAVALFPDGFGPKLLGEPLHLTVKEPEWWLAQFSSAGLKVYSHAVEKTTSGQLMWLHAFATVERQ